MRIRLEDEEIALEERPKPGRDVAPVSFPDDRGDRDVAIGQRF
jgi:hypothetical protein